MYLWKLIYRGSLVQKKNVKSLFVCGTYFRSWIDRSAIHIGWNFFNKPGLYFTKNISMETESLNIVISLKHTFYADKIHRSTFQKIEGTSIVLLRRTWRPICQKKLLAEVRPIHACLYVTYVIESTLYSCLKWLEISRNSLLETGAKSDCNWIQTYNHLFRSNDWAVLRVLICTVYLTVCSYHIRSKEPYR